jgi:hypothetical protein
MHRNVRERAEIFGRKGEEVTRNSRNIDKRELDGLYSCSLFV